MSTNSGEEGTNKGSNSAKEAIGDVHMQEYYCQPGI